MKEHFLFRLISKKLYVCLLSLFLSGYLLGQNPTIIVYVNISVSVSGSGLSGWGDAMKYLQDALAYVESQNPSANDPYQIWVAQGSYKPDQTGDNLLLGDPTISFSMLDHVSIYGGFAGTETSIDDRIIDLYVTILSGDIGIPDDYSDNSCCIIYNENIQNSILDGFTITGVRNTHFAYGGGYGSIKNKFSNITIENCVFDNNAISWGDFISGVSTTLVCRNSIFRNNEDYSDVIEFRNDYYNPIPFSMEFENCLFENNNNYGDLSILTCRGNIDYLVVSNSIFRNNYCTTSGALYLEGEIGSLITIKNTSFFNNTTEGNGGAILCINSSLIMQNCVLANNKSGVYSQSGLGGGLCYSINDDSYTCDIVNCTFYGNEVSHDQIIGDGKAIAYSHPTGSGYDHNLTVVNSILWDSTNLEDEKEIWTSDGLAVGVTFSNVFGGYPNNISLNPEFVDPDNKDFHIKKISPCRDVGNNYAQYLPTFDFEGDNRKINLIVDIGADERKNVIHVDADNYAYQNPDGSRWEKAFYDLQDALDIADSDDEIWVAEGYYYPSESPYGSAPEENLFQIEDEFSLYGGFKGDELERKERDWTTYHTILSGYIDGSSNCYRVVLAFFCDVGQAIVDGFIIEDANSDQSGFTGNSGGMIISTYSNLKVSNCTFRNNIGGGINNMAASSLEIENCIFDDNTASTHSSPFGGGIRCIDSYLSAVGCTFIGNTSDRGGAIYHHGNLSGIGYGYSTIINCIFSQNIAYRKGGAIYNNELVESTDASEVILISNSSFSNNEAPDGRTIYTEMAKSLFENCILWDENPIPGDLIINSNGGVTEVNYSDIKGGYSGVENINDPPDFYDPTNHDLHLKSVAGRWDPDNGWVTIDLTNSPCIDVGDPSIQPDPFNELKPHGGIINMGAYGNTWQASKTYISKGEGDFKRVAINDNKLTNNELLQISPNPFSNFTEIFISLSISTDIVLNIYDMNGQNIYTVYSGKAPKGDHSFIWSGINNNGQKLNNGIYLVVLTANDIKKVKKVVLLR